MKKIFLLSFIITLLVSCSPDDSQLSFHTEVLPIENVTIPDEFQFGEVYQIGVTYFRPTGCHIFNNFYYDINENERIVAVITTVYDEQDCQTFEPEENEVEVAFNFQVNSFDTYTFKFFQGLDENDNDLYYIIEVPVVE
ncbi:hypothetical protein [Psychroserpens damuponensis]|uniref:hypothetical protein n=1 Tax=Psychroserpens damuponensis TaxID=943936 RepID=UPI00058F5F5A|nr:hypothetical protein [Psychroserpens damuponensis]